MKDWGVRQASYDRHFAEGRTNTCTFCGIETIDGPRLRNADWDHYLARTLYPFASWRIRNLSPMGDLCNRSYKKAADVLRSVPPARSACFDPYSEPETPTDIHLRATNPVVTSDRPNWRVTIVGDPQRVRTWNAVFRVEDRWKHHLDAKYRYCLSILTKSFGKQLRPTDARIATMIGRRAERTAVTVPGVDLLAEAIFDMWHHALTLRDQRAAELVKQLTSIVSGSRSGAE